MKYDAQATDFTTNFTVISKYETKLSSQLEEFVYIQMTIHF